MYQTTSKLSGMKTFVVLTDAVGQEFGWGWFVSVSQCQGLNWKAQRLGVTQHGAGVGGVGLGLSEVSLILMSDS